jgi:predicted transcriptional regulator
VFENSLRYIGRSCLNKRSKTKKAEAGGMAQMVKHFLNKIKAMSSHSSITTTKRKNKQTKKTNKIAFFSNAKKILDSKS